MNPVITPGTLWGRICDDPGDECRRAAGSARSPTRARSTSSARDGDGWWVGFHGYDGAHGYRGIARTRDVPARRLAGRRRAAARRPTPRLDAGDAAGWREYWAPGGPVGRRRRERSSRRTAAYYQLVEVPDVEPRLHAGAELGPRAVPDRATSASTTLGAVSRAATRSSTRAASPTPTGDVDPPATSSIPACSRIRRRARPTSCTAALSDDPAYDGIYVYRLEWDRNLLAQRRLLARRRRRLGAAAPAPRRSCGRARARTSRRTGRRTSSFNCGAPRATAGRAVYQDVARPPGARGRRARVRRHVPRRQRATGRLELGASCSSTRTARWSSARSSRSTRRRATRRRAASSRSTTARAHAALRARTRARPGTLRADNLYLIPQDGCEAPRYPAC